VPNTLQQARIAIESQNIEHARRLLGQLLQANPDQDEAWVLLAQVIKTPEWQRWRFRWLPLDTSARLH